MKSNTPRTWLAAILVGLVAVCFITVTGWLLASPSEEIAAAVSSSGAQSVKQANPEQFLNAVASVLVGVDKKQSGPYVAAAVQARPDLKARIMATVAEINSNATTVDTGNNDVSQNQRKCKVCHKGHTITIPCKQVDKFLQQHPGATRGPCP